MRVVGARVLPTILALTDPQVAKTEFARDQVGSQ